MANTPLPSSQSSQSGPYTLPPGLTPDTIDTLPVLSALIHNLTLSSTSSSSSNAPTNNPAQLPTSQPHPTSPTVITKKDVLPITDPLKHKLQKARRLVKDLPDVERSLEEQEEEIRELEARINKQKRVLDELKVIGEDGKVGKVKQEEDVIMAGSG